MHMYIESIKYVLVEVCRVENGNLVVPVNNTLVNHTSWVLLVLYTIRREILVQDKFGKSWAIHQIFLTNTQELLPVWFTKIFSCQIFFHVG